MIKIASALALAVALGFSQHVLSLTYHVVNDIYFPRPGEVVAPEARIIIGESGGGLAKISLEENEHLLDSVILTNRFGDVIPLVPTLGGLRPEHPLAEGRYKVRYIHRRTGARPLEFSVSKHVPISMPSGPEDFHWNLKVFERRLGYVYNTCFRNDLRQCNQYFITARFKTRPLLLDQTFVHYQVGLYLDSRRTRLQHPFSPFPMEFEESPKP